MDGQDSLCCTGICLNVMNRKQQGVFDRLEGDGLEPRIVGFGDASTAAVECNDGITRWITFMGRCWEVSVHAY